MSSTTQYERISRFQCCTEPRTYCASTPRKPPCFCNWSRSPIMPATLGCLKTSGFSSVIALRIESRHTICIMTELTRSATESQKIVRRRVLWAESTNSKVKGSRFQSAHLANCTMQTPFPQFGQLFGKTASHPKMPPTVLPPAQTVAGHQRQWQQSLSTWLVLLIALLDWSISNRVCQELL